MRRSSFLFAALLAAGCATKSDPNQGRYSCQTDADCGAGYECHAQFAGGSLCFKAGTCAAVEQCNGIDDTCDGRIDETFPGQGAACDTGNKGVCQAGVKACADGGVVCAQQKQPSPEVCNGLDDDCDGTVDNGFDLTTDSRNCGTCGHVCPGGTACTSSACAETDCSDGLDNDLNGKIDCQDPACLHAVCVVTDGGNFHCGAIPAADGGGGPCVPQTCAQQGLTCGLQSDGCGAPITCGPPCDAGFCPAVTCADAGVTCGFTGDHCGNLLNCGPCDGGACTPKTCQQLPWACGLTGDGCAGLMDCGPCPADAGAVDAGARDAGALDGGAVDAGATDAGATDAGATDAGATDAGVPGRLGCFPPETNCSNGLDDDGNGLTDCADPSCAGRTCGVGKTCSAGACQ